MKEEANLMRKEVRVSRPPRLNTGIPAGHVSLEHQVERRDDEGEMMDGKRGPCNPGVKEDQLLGRGRKAKKGFGG